MLKTKLTIAILLSICYGAIAQASTDTVKFTIEKYCESIYEIVDAGKKPPRPKRIIKYKAIRLKPTQESDSVVVYQQNIKGLQVDVVIRTGQVKLTHPTSYYTGHDASQLPAWSQGVKQIQFKLNKRNIPIQFDHILHANPRDLIVMKDITAPRFFLFLTNGDGAGTDNSFWIIQNNKVAGHYDWEYGYDEWTPRDGLDAYPMKAPSDKCTVYKFTGLLY